MSHYIRAKVRIHKVGEREDFSQIEEEKGDNEEKKRQLTSSLINVSFEVSHVVS